MNMTTISAILELYPIAEFSEAAAQVEASAEYMRVAQFFRDVDFACPSINFALEVTRQGSAGYVYELNQTAFSAIFASLGVSYLGVAHSSDIPFVFNYADKIDYDASVGLLAKKMSGSWANFASTGFPFPNVSYWPMAFERNPKESPLKLKLHVMGGLTDGVADIGGESGLQSESALMKRCAFINSAMFYSQSQT